MNICAPILSGTPWSSGHIARTLRELYVGDGKKWNQQAELTTKDLNADRQDAARLRMGGLPHRPP